MSSPDLEKYLNLSRAKADGLKLTYSRAIGYVAASELKGQETADSYEDKSRKRLDELEKRKKEILFTGKLSKNVAATLQLNNASYDTFLVTKNIQIPGPYITQGFGDSKWHYPSQRKIDRAIRSIRAASFGGWSLNVVKETWHTVTEGEGANFTRYKEMHDYILGNDGVIYDIENGRQDRPGIITSRAKAIDIGDTLDVATALEGLSNLIVIHTLDPEQLANY